MSDTWSDLQAFKSRQSSIRERLQRRKQEVKGIVLGITNELSGASTGSRPASPASSSALPVATTAAPNTTTTGDTDSDVKPDSEIEQQLLVCMCDAALNLPTDSRALAILLGKALNRKIPHLSVENLLQKFAVQELITIEESLTPEGKTCLIVSSAEHTKLLALSVAQRKVSTESDSGKQETRLVSEEEPKPKKLKDNGNKDKIEDSIEDLLSLPSAREKETKMLGAEILELLSKPTAKEKSLVKRFRSQGGAQVKEFCPHGVTEECMKVSGIGKPCDKLHFKKIIQKHTDESLGDCSFLNTCFHMDTCKYVHYEVDYSTVISISKNNKSDANLFKDPLDKPTVLYPSQWIQCDLRFFDMLILGKFAVIMADPPWDIHMELPYGTMSDDEMRQLNVPGLQDEGLIFLWVTGRAMELGRECLRLWGYQRCDEIIWVKTNQLQRIIRTGRTGHWLNHGKEHCLVGVKGNVQNFNRGLDCDVIVAEVRATSHKPDEIYGIIERLSPGTRKIELFGRPHNVQPNWITLGNQLDGVRLLDPVLIEEFRKRYPDGNCLKKE